MKNIVLYAAISKYQDDGWSISCCTEEQWEYICDPNENIRLMNLEVEGPSSKWLAEHGLAYVARMIEEEKANLVKRVNALREMEAKFLLLTCDN